MLKRLVGMLATALAGAVFVWPAQARAQEPAGSKFRVNSFTTGLQSQPAVAGAPNGDFVVVWSSDQVYGQFRDVFGQRYDAGGRPRGSEFRISETFSDDRDADVAANALGDFVAVWWNFTASVVKARRYAEDGTPSSLEVTIGSGGYPAVARAASGPFVIVWASPLGGALQRFDIAGNPVGAQFSTGIAGRMDVAMAPSGDFVVVGEAGFSPNTDVVARCFDPTAFPKGPVFVVNSYLTGSQLEPRVAIDSSGRFVVTWSSFGQDGSSWGVIARAFDAGCNPLGPDEVVNTRTNNPQVDPDVGADATDAFLVTWSDSKSPQRIDVMGRRISSSGAFRGSEFEVQAAAPTVGASGGFYPRVAGGPEGTFNVVWEERPTGMNTDVYGRRLRPLGARAIDVDGVDGPASDGNRVFEPGETVRVAPAWFNSVERLLPAQGQAASFTGPLGNGVSYALFDPVADYGTITPGATGSCLTTGDCYSLGITQPGSRPVTHWDARFVEDLQPATLGGAHEWTLHVGDSFQDSPRANPYYRFIETLLHSGVAAGCAAAQFCPASPTTREQMAVLVLKAREGPAYTPPACQFSLFVDVPPSSPYCPYINELVFRDVVGGCASGPPSYYCPGSPVTREQMSVFVLRTLDPALAPPACTTPMFTDVPASSPFCRWIEELARRGVTSGCGGGNYCPAQAVSREQMSVFLTATFGLTLYAP